MTDLRGDILRALRATEPRPGRTARTLGDLADAAMTAVEARRDVLTARVTLAEKHLADVLHALDHAHVEQGCHCAPGPCALSAPWVPDSIRHTPHGQPRSDDDDHVAAEARRLIALLCAGGPP